MRLGNLKIKINPPGRKNLWAFILAGVSLGCFITGGITTHWVLNYKKGYSEMIPQESQLLRYGPLFMARHRIKSGDEVLFYNKNGDILFKEQYFSIPQKDILVMVDKFAKAQVAYLWISDINPIRKVWEVDVNGQRILDLQQSIMLYGREIGAGYGNLFASAFFAIWFIVSIFDVSRVEEEKTQSKSD